MSRRRKDATDYALEAWARQRRRIVGAEDPLTAREFLGALPCTLGRRRDLHANAKSDGKRTQHWPEVYVGREAQAVNAAYWASTPEVKWVLDVHYVVRLPAAVKIDVTGLSTTTYFDLVRRARSFVKGRLSGEDAPT